MSDFIINLTDSGGLNEQIAAHAATDCDLGSAAKLAIDQIVRMSGGELTFPVFLDIHPAEAFGQVASLYAARYLPPRVGLN